MVISGDYTHSFFLSNPKDLCQKSPIWKLGCDHVVEVKQKTDKSEMGAAKKRLVIKIQSVSGPAGTIVLYSLARIERGP